MRIRVWRSKAQDKSEWASMVRNALTLISCNANDDVDDN